MPHDLPKPHDIIFLGFAERVSVARDAAQLPKWNVLGLKSVIPAYFFPMSLDGWHMALAARLSDELYPTKLRLRTETGEELGWLNLEVHRDSAALPDTGSFAPVVSSGPNSWGVVFVLIGDVGIVMPKPGHYLVSMEVSETQEVNIGDFFCVLGDPPPLTPERVAAILSNPKSTKAVRAEYRCKSCAGEFRVYTALERDPRTEAGGYSWYQDIPDQFACACGKMQFDLRSIRRNFHGLLGINTNTSRSTKLVPLYESTALEVTRLDFLSLLNRKPKEEVIQQFIEDNPVTLHQFAAEKLLFKPAILTFFKADFAIVNPQRELILIEIELSTMRLLTRKGAQSAALTHAFTQVNSWLHSVDEHRQAVLDTLGIDRNAVNKVRGVVVAGRDAGNDAKHLRVLKGTDHGRVTFLTYDDLAAGLAVLAQNIGEL